MRITLTDADKHRLRHAATTAHYVLEDVVSTLQADELNPEDLETNLIHLRELAKSMHMVLGDAWTQALEDAAPPLRIVR